MRLREQLSWVMFVMCSAKLVRMLFGSFTVQRIKWLLLGALIAILLFEDSGESSEPEIPKDAIGFLGFKPEDE